MVRLFSMTVAAVLITACSSSSTSTSATPVTGSSSNGAPSAASPGAAGAAGAASVSPVTVGAASSSPVAASPNVAGAQSVTVNMTDANQFQPATITVPRGGTVTWVNTGQSQHTVTDDPSKAASPSDSALPSGAQAWDSGAVNGGQSFSRTFDTPGQYTYFCIPHESLGMIGHITVSQ